MTTRFTMGANFRSRFEPPLPDTWFGNSVFLPITATITVAELQEKSLPEIARMHGSHVFN